MEKRPPRHALDGRDLAQRVSQPPQSFLKR